MIINRLRDYLSKRDIEMIRIKYAEVFTVCGKHQEALEQYTLILGAHPFSMGAKLGLERLEKIMKGEDPDAEEAAEEEGEEGEEGEEEGEEAEEGAA